MCLLGSQRFDLDAIRLIALLKDLVKSAIGLYSPSQRIYEKVDLRDDRQSSYFPLSIEQETLLSKGYYTRCITVQLALQTASSNSNWELKIEN